MFRRLFLDLLFMGRRGCASAMGMIKFPSSCSSPKALCNQFIDYYICSRGVFCINHIKLRNFVVITIECSIATVDRGSIMTRIYRWSMMVYSSLQAEFMVTKYDGSHCSLSYVVPFLCWYPYWMSLHLLPRSTLQMCHLETRLGRNNWSKWWPVIILNEPRDPLWIGSPPADDSAQLNQPN